MLASQYSWKDVYAKPYVKVSTGERKVDIRISERVLDAILTKDSAAIDGFLMSLAGFSGRQVRTPVPKPLKRSEVLGI